MENKVRKEVNVMVDHKRLGSKEYQNWTETRTTPDREES